ncbi:hypothetical protein BDP55DRAFT_638566 [Colletotrichum godetiae]|uniref:Uncharacterized protein n=1 Tax=Colletotrichum godetiae TaxID=1209918 RepID=A0AAJ0A712_9PEZI|nr:uncharacterized protein BDP55DRAFT_638566 [Colletotrichum godetiae]KAK1657673.1 hypothetical protein BDP55DRAFT_638566 [Colletotrichum godetiae]
MCGWLQLEFLCDHGKIIPLVLCGQARESNLDPYQCVGKEILHTFVDGSVFCCKFCPTTVSYEKPDLAKYSRSEYFQRMDNGLRAIWPRIIQHEQVTAFIATHKGIIVTRGTPRYKPLMPNINLQALHIEDPGLNALLQPHGEEFIKFSYNWTLACSPGWHEAYLADITCRINLVLIWACSRQVPTHGLKEWAISENGALRLSIIQAAILKSQSWQELAYLIMAMDGFHRLIPSESSVRSASSGFLPNLFDELLASNSATAGSRGILRRVKASMQRAMPAKEDDLVASNFRQLEFRVRVEDSDHYMDDYFRVRMNKGKEEPGPDHDAALKHVRTRSRDNEGLHSKSACCFCSLEGGGD